MVPSVIFGDTASPQQKPQREEEMMLERQFCPVTTPAEELFTG